MLERLKIRTMGDIPRPMHQVQVNIIHAQILQRLVQRRLNIFGCMLGIPQLASNEDLFARNARLADAISNLRLVAIDGCAVDVTIALFQSHLHGIFDLERLSLPCSKSHGRNFCTGVEREVCRESHCEREGTQLEILS